jgi:hypothetical protein
MVDFTQILPQRELSPEEEAAMMRCYHHPDRDGEFIELPGGESPHAPLCPECAETYRRDHVTT